MHVLTSNNTILVCQLSAVGRSPESCLKGCSILARSSVSWSPPNTTLSSELRTYLCRNSKMWSMSSWLFSFWNIIPRLTTLPFCWNRPEYSWGICFATYFRKGLRSPGGNARLAKLKCRNPLSTSSVLDYWRGIWTGTYLRLQMGFSLGKWEDGTGFLKAIARNQWWLFPGLSSRLSRVDSLMSMLSPASLSLWSHSVTFFL